MLNGRYKSKSGPGSLVLCASRLKKKGRKKKKVGNALGAQSAQRVIFYTFSFSFSFGVAREREREREIEKCVGYKREEEDTFIHWLAREVYRRIDTNRQFANSANGPEDTKNGTLL